MAERDSCSTPSLWLTNGGEESSSSLFPGSSPGSGVGFIGQGAYACVPTAYDPRGVCGDLIVVPVCCESVMRGRSRWQRLAASHASAAPRFPLHRTTGLDDGLGIGKDPTARVFGLGNPFLPYSKGPHPPQSITLKTTPHLTRKADGFPT